MSNKKITSELIHLITLTSNIKRLNIQYSIEYLIKELKTLKQLEKDIQTKIN